MKLLALISIRSLLLLTKFVFLIFAASYLTVNQYADYSIIVYVLTVLIFFSGIEAHSILGRKFSKIKNQTLRNQLLFSHSLIIIMGLFLSLCFFLFAYIFYLDEEKTFLFFLLFTLLIFEVISQELTRYLIYLDKQIHSNIVQLIKGGLWIILLILCFSDFNQNIRLEIIFSIWTLFSLISCIYAAFFCKEIFRYNFIRKFSEFIRRKKLNILKKHVFLTLNQAKIYFFITIVYLVMINTDKFIANIYLDTDSVAPLAFYFNLTNIIPTLIQVGVISVFFNKALDITAKKEIVNIKLLFKKMYFYTGIIYFVSAIFIFLFIDPLLKFVDKEIFLDNKRLLYFYMIGNLFLSLSFINHLFCYGFKKDTALMKLTVIIFIIYAPLSYILMTNFDILGISYAYVIMGFSLCFSKLRVFNLRVKKIEKLLNNN